MVLFMLGEDPGIFYVHFQEVVTHGGPDQGYYGGFWRGDGGRDGEDSGDVCGGVQGFSGKRYITERAVDGKFYAEGVLKMYSFPG